MPDSPVGQTEIDVEELRASSPCALGIHNWGRWYNLEGGPPYRQRRRCYGCPATEER